MKTKYGLKTWVLVQGALMLAVSPALAAEPTAADDTPPAAAKTSSVATEPSSAALSAEASSTESEEAAPVASAPSKKREDRNDLEPLRNREDLSKPWRINANFTQSLGQGSFVSERYARRPLYAYAIGLGGSYRVHPLVRVGARLGADQQLSITNADGGTLPREFFIRDLQLSATAPDLWHEDYTGIRVTAGADLMLPFSKASLDQEMILAARLRAGLFRLFEDVGPGTLRLSWNGGFRYNFSPAARSLDSGESASIVRTCSTPARTDGGECFSSFANPRYSISNSFTVSYFFLEKLTATVDLTFVNGVSSGLRHSEVVSLRAGDVEVGRSPNANDSRTHSDLTIGTLEIAYDINSNFSASFGLLTQQNPFIQRGASSRSLRFPFWDFSSEADNLSTFYLDVAFSY